MTVRVFGPYPGRIVGAPTGYRVRAASVVVVARHSCRERCRRVVVEDQRLACELREIDDDVSPLSRGEQQRVLVHVADIENGRVGDPGGRLVGDDDRRRQETAFGADLDPIGSRWAEGRVRGREDDRVGLCGGQLGGIQRDLAQGPGGGVGHVPLQIPEAVVCRVEDAQPVRLRRPVSPPDRRCR